MFGFLNRAGKYQYDNTRAYIRIPAHWPIKCELQDDPNVKQLSETKDVSAGGVRVFLKEPIPSGTKVLVSIMIPDLNRSISAKAEVVRCLPANRKHYDVGIRFLEIDPEEQATLKAFVDQKVPKRKKVRHLKNWWRKV